MRAFNSKLKAQLRSVSTLSNATLASLEAVCDRVSTNADICNRHGDDESFNKAVAPDCVCFAHSTEQVQAVMKLCSEARIPIIPFGTGTSLEGHIQAVEGGVSLDLSEMKGILEINDEDLDCRVQAGVTRVDLNTELRYTGLHFPVDPGADASLGLILCDAVT